MRTEGVPDENQMLLDDWAATVCDNVALRTLLQEWHELFSPVVHPGTESASLVEMTREALASSLRYSRNRRAD